jgi:hypothetical protein
MGGFCFYFTSQRKTEDILELSFGIIRKGYFNFPKMKMKIKVNENKNYFELLLEYDFPILYFCFYSFVSMRINVFRHVVLGGLVRTCEWDREKQPPVHLLIYICAFNSRWHELYLSKS